MKRKLSLLMVLMMIVSMVPMSAFAATGVDLKEDSKDVRGFVGGSKVVVSFTTAEVAEFEAGTTITFDSRDEVKRNEGTTSNDVALSGSVATVRQDGLNKALSFEVKLGDEVGTRRLAIRTGNEIERFFYAEVVQAGKTGAELLESKVRFSQGAGNVAVASFILRSPGEGKVTLSLPKDFEWAGTPDVIGATNTPVIGEVVNGTTINKNILTFNAGARDVVVNPVIKQVNRNASFGDVEVEIDSEDITTELIIGELADYDINVKVDKERTVLAGERSDEIKVTLSGVPNSFVANRDIVFELDGAKVHSFGELKNSSTPVLNSDDDEFYIQANGNLNTMDEIVIRLRVVADLDSKGGDVTLTVQGGGVEKQTVSLIEVTPRAKFETKVTNIAVTNVDTATANMVITESQAGALPVGKHRIQFVGREDRKPEFTNVEVSVDGNAEVKAKTLSNGVIELEVTRASRRDGAVITIKDIEVTVPRNVLPGTYEVELRIDRGNKDDDGAIKFERVAKWDYVNVMEPGAVVRQTTVFTLDSAVFTVDGEQMMLDAAPYISNNRTMLPIGTMAQLLGATVNYSPATRTAVFTRNNLVVSMNLDNNVLLVNGVPVMMDAKPEIKNDRAFVPVVFVAQAFGVQNGVDIVFDAATRTVTLFPNN